MKTLKSLLAASLIAVAAWAPAALAEEPAAEKSQPSGADQPKNCKMRQYRGSMQDEGSRTRESYGDVVLRNMDALKLSDEQIGKITRIHQENQRKVEEIGKKLREAKQTAYALFLNPTSDEAAIRKAAKDYSAAFDEMVDTTLKTRTAISGLLTPEQLTQLKSIKTEP